MTENNPENHKINIHDGIHTLGGYVKYPHTPASIEDYENIVKSIGTTSNVRTEKIVGNGRFTYGSKYEPINDKEVASKLMAEFNLNGVHARYQTDGTFYNLLDGFPGILFDLYGYVIFATESDVVGVADKPKEKKPTRKKGLQLAPGEKPIPYRNKYVSGICPTCKDEFTDLESHFVRYPTHKK